MQWVEAKFCDITGFWRKDEQLQGLTPTNILLLAENLDMDGAVEISFEYMETAACLMQFNI